MEEAARSLIEFVERASPLIWEAGRTEVLSSIVRSTLWLILIGAGLYLLWRVAGNWWNGLDEHDRNNGDQQVIFGLSIFAIVCGIAIMAVILSGVLSRVINPDYYAIHYITHLWPGA